MTINGLRAVKDRIRGCGAPHKVEITKGVLRAANEAHKAYSKRLSDEKELTNKKRSEEIEKQRLRDAEKGREREAEKLEKSRANLAETEQKLMKSEKHKGSELQAIQILYDEAKDRLSEAIKNNNFNQATVAQGLLEVAEKKMEHAMDQTRMCSSKRTQLDKNKKDSWKIIPNMYLPRRVNHKDRNITENIKDIYSNLCSESWMVNP